MKHVTVFWVLTFMNDMNTSADTMGFMQTVILYLCIKMTVVCCCQPSAQIGSSASWWYITKSTSLLGYLNYKLESKLRCRRHSMMWWLRFFWCNEWLLNGEDSLEIQKRRASLCSEWSGSKFGISNLVW